LAPSYFLPVELPDRLFARSLVGHGHKSKPAWATASRPGHNERIFNLPNLTENLAQIIGVGIEREISYIETDGHNFLNYRLN
jgi:hypothetical protein